MTNVFWTDCYVRIVWPGFITVSCRFSVRRRDRFEIVLNEEEKSYSVRRPSCMPGRVLKKLCRQSEQEISKSDSGELRGKIEDLPELLPFSKSVHPAESLLQI